MSETNAGSQANLPLPSEWRRAARRMAVIFWLLAASLAAPAANAPWVEVRSPRFSVMTDAGEKRGREVADRFEQMRFAFGVVFQRVNVNLPVPLQIIAFRNNRELQRYSPLWNGKPVQLAGFYQGSEDRNFIALDLDSEAGWEIVFHEYAHLLMNGSLPPMPAWFDEGFAEYCASLKVTNKEIDLGLIPENRPRTLAQSSWMKTADLLAVKHDSREYNEGDRRSVFYAQSWLTVHYLMSKRKMTEVARFLQYSGEQHLAVRDAFRKAFAMDVEQFDKELRSYFEGQTSYFKMPAPAAMATVTFTTRAVDELEASATLADLHYHSSDYREQAVKEFEDVIRQQPNNAVANRGLGYAYLRANRLDEAARCFQRAAAQDSKDPRVHYFVAMLLSRKLLTGGEDALEEMTKEAETAIALDPNYADAYSLLAFAQARSGDTKVAIQTGKKAVDLSPRNQMYAANLAQLYLQDQDFDEARPLLVTLAGSDNPSLAAMAKMNLERLDEFSQHTLPRADPRQAGAGPPPVLRSGDSPRSETRPGLPPVEGPAPSPQPTPVKIEFLHGRIEGVDCSAAPGAVLTVTAGTTTWKFAVRDIQHVVIIGADAFACSWKSQRVAVNYRPTGSNTGDIVSIELQ